MWLYFWLLEVHNSREVCLVSSSHQGCSEKRSHCRAPFQHQAPLQQQAPQMHEKKLIFRKPGYIKIFKQPLLVKVRLGIFIQGTLFPWKQLQLSGRSRTQVQGPVLQRNPGNSFNLPGPSFPHLYRCTFTSYSVHTHLYGLLVAHPDFKPLSGALLPELQPSSQPGTQPSGAPPTLSSLLRPEDPRGPHSWASSNHHSREKCGLLFYSLLPKRGSFFISPILVKLLRSLGTRRRE